MEPPYVVVGFYKNERRFLALNRIFGKCEITKDLDRAITFTGEGAFGNAAVAALAMGEKFNLAHCRAVDINEAMNVLPA